MGTQNIVNYMDPTWEEFWTGVATGEIEKGDILWNSYIHGVDWNPEEQVFVDTTTGEIVEDAQMANPDYVPAQPGTEKKVINPEWVAWRNNPDIRNRGQAPPRTIIQTTDATAVQGEEYIDNPDVEQMTNEAFYGDYRGINLDDVYDDEGNLLHEGVVSEYELDQRAIQAAGDEDLPEKTAELEGEGLETGLLGEDVSQAALNAALGLNPDGTPIEGATTQADTVLSGNQATDTTNKLTTAQGLDAIANIEYGDTIGLDESEMDALLATNQFTEAEAKRALSLLNYGEEIGLDEAQMDALLAQAGFDKTKYGYLEEILKYRKETGVDKLGVDVEKLKLQDDQTLIEERAPVRRAFFEEALNGVDRDTRASEAATDVSIAFDKSQEGNIRSLARRGLAPTLENTDTSMDRAKLIATAKTGARNQADTESFARKQTALALY